MNDVKLLNNSTNCKHSVQLRAAFKFGRGVHFALRCKMRKSADFSCTSNYKWTNKSPKLKEGQHLRRYSQVTTDTAIDDFNSGQFKVWVKKMAAQVNFYLYPNAFLSSELFGAWKLAHICQIKALLTYLMLMVRVLMVKQTFFHTLRPPIRSPTLFSL